MRSSSEVSEDMSIGMDEVEEDDVDVLVLWDSFGDI